MTKRKYRIGMTSGDTSKRYYAQLGIRSWEIVDTGEYGNLKIMFADACSEQDALRLCERLNKYQDDEVRIGEAVSEIIDKLYWAKDYFKDDGIYSECRDIILKALKECEKNDQ